MDIGGSIITAALTVAGGVVVYVTGRIIERAFIEPVNAQADAITDLIKTLEFYRDLYANPDRWLADAYESDVREMVREFRRVAATLAARNRTIPWHGLLRALGLIPRRADVFMATFGLYLIIEIVTSWPPEGARVTEDSKKAVSEGLVAIGNTVKDQLHVGERPIADDFVKMMEARPKEQYEELVRILREHRDRVS